MQYVDLVDLVWILFWTIQLLNKNFMWQSENLNTDWKKDILIAAIFVFRCDNDLLYFLKILSS